MDFGNISGMLSGILPYLSYLVNLFTKLLETFSSYLGVDITIPAPADDTDDGADTGDDADQG